MNSLTVTELKAIAKGNGIVGYSNMTKAELIERLG
nr:Rho termination factor N-terminal domain-containing protein [Paeniclostridium ghonii]